METNSTPMAASANNQQVGMPVFTPQELCAIDTTWKEAYALIGCGIVPKAFIPKRPGDVPSELFLAMQFCREKEISLVSFFTDYCVIDGKIAKYSTKVIREINADRRFEGGVFYNPIRDKEGNVIGYYCSAVDAVTKKEVFGSAVTMDMANRFGWTRNKIWQQMPNQMLMYRAAAFFARLYGVGVDGLRTADEEADIAASKGRLNEVDAAIVEADCSPVEDKPETKAQPQPKPQPAQPVTVEAEPVVSPIRRRSF